MEFSVYIDGHYVFVTEYSTGLKILDISDSSNPSRPEKIVSFNDGGWPKGIQVIGDLIYVADGSDGLEIIKYRKDQ